MNGQDLEPAEALKQKKAIELLASLRLARDMITGGMNGEPGKSRLEMDPDGLAQDLAEFFEFTKNNLGESLPPDWKATFKVDPVKATALAILVDAPVPYIVKPLIVEGSLTQIQGIQKGGKSAFSLLLSLCLATGTWPYPQYFAAAEPEEVLYLAWEDPELMMAKRLALYANGLGLGERFMPEKLTFLFGPDLFVEREDHELALRAAIQELKPKVIFIDTLSHIHLCDENSSSEMKIPMKTLARIARDCKVGIVYLHHTGKGSGDKLAQDKSRGSGAIAAAWHVLIDWGTREKGSNVNPVEVQSKYEHEWKQWAIAYEPQKDDFGNVTAVKWSVDGSEVQSKKDPSSGDKRRTRILQVFNQVGVTREWMTAQEIALICNLGLDERSLRRHLQKMCENGDLESKQNETKGPLHYKLAVPQGNLSGTNYQ